MESFIKDALMEHLNSNKLLSPYQHGFISGRSTVTQLLSFLDTCIQSIINGKEVDVIYLDFMKAFDTVPHKRLVNKLKAYGVSGEILDWITEYLKDRTQVVVLNGEKSNIGIVISGIPQGTVLGPLLFVIYINDLLDSIESNGFLFADDAKLLREITCQADSLNLQNDIKILEEWSKDCFLQFHPDKCHILTLGKFENINYTHRYTVYDKEIEHVAVEKDLGITMDSELTFSDHITEKVNKANSLVGIIRRCFSFLDKETFMKLYPTFVRPHLEYGQEISKKVHQYDRKRPNKSNQTH